MSEKYDEYIKEHRENVGRAFDWLEKNLPEIFNGDEEFIKACHRECHVKHDMSKHDAYEYDAYDKYFYGKNKSFEVVQDFNKAWLHHIHMNSHHWQHWVLINDDPNEGEIILDMPYIDIIEMICDWWSFSWKKGNLWEIFEWYDERKEYIKLSKDTRKKVMDILGKIQEKLNELENRKEE